MATCELRSLPVIFPTFVPQLWPSIYAIISFPLSILRKDRFSPNFIKTRSSLVLLHIIFRTFLPGLWPLIYVRILCSAQYLENKLTEFDQTLYNHL